MRPFIVNKYLQIAILLLFVYTSSAKDLKADALWMQWATVTNNDTVRLQALYDYTLLLMNNAPDSAITLANKMHDYAQKINASKYEAKAQLLTGMALIEMSNYTEALIQLDKCISMAGSIGDKATAAVAYCNKAGVFYRTGDLIRAFELNTKALKLAEASQNYFALTWAHNSQASIYMDKEEMTYARAHFNEALKYARLAKDTGKMAIAIGNIGNTYDYRDSMQMKCFEQSLTWAKAINNIKMQSYVLRSIGNRFGLLRQYNLAAQYFSLSLDKAIERKDKYQEALTYGYLGTMYVQAASYEKAIAVLKKCLQVNEAVNDLDIYSEAYKYLYQANKALRRTGDALAAHEQYMLFKDSLSSEGLARKIEQKESELKFRQAEEQLKAKQEKKNAIAQQQLQKQKIIRNSFIAGSVLLLLLIVVLINRNKLKRAVEIEKMRSRLSRDLHDDIGSTLSSINILSRTAQASLHGESDKKTRASLEKINERSQRLLDSMSDIIWNIRPGNDTIEEVMSRMREYATTVLEASGIDYVFNFPRQQTDYHLTMEVKNNLYLIFKEAVNNLVKYAACTQAIFSISITEKGLLLQVEDNGLGFDIDAVKHLGGLNNMMWRAEEMNSTIQVQSAPGKGTSILLTIPRHHSYS